MVPRYFALALWFVTLSFVYVSYLHELSAFSFFFLLCLGVCVPLASGELSDSSGKRVPLFWGLLCGGEKKPLYFLYVQHGRVQNEHTERWLKFTDLQNSLSSLPFPPHPLGLEVMAACDKGAHSFINVRFSIHPAFWKSLNLHEYFISGKKMCP